MVTKLSRNLISADIDVNKGYHVTLTVHNLLFCAHMVRISDSALVFRLAELLKHTKTWSWSEKMDKNMEH